MKPYRIQNDIVAARDEREAIAAWAQHSSQPFNSAGPVEEVPLTLEISVEDEDGEWRPGTIEEVMPTSGPACVIALGDHEDGP